MANLLGAVGKNGVNAPVDVRLVQQLLNKFKGIPGGKDMDVNVNGKIDKSTIQGIEVFQKLVVGMSRPDGVVDPGGKTWKALNGSPPKIQKIDPKKLSGAGWWRANQAKFPNSDKVGDLNSSFQGGVKAFLRAVTDAGAKVVVSSTLRNKDRAFLMHYSWMVAHGKIKPEKVPSNSNIDIEWNHGDDKASIQGAKEMVSLFGLRYQPSLNSRHIEGKAIDMSITWSKPMVVTGKDGKQRLVGKPFSGEDNDDLHTVAETYGVKKNKKDPPHWSTDGH